MAKLAVCLLLGWSAYAWDVGSDACAACHASIFKGYRASPMAQSSGRMNPSKQWESFERNKVGRVTVSQSQTGDVSFTVGTPEAQLKRKLDYFVGSGLVGRSYLSDLQGFLFQAPVSYYTSQARWDISPGFEKRDELSLTRAVEPACLRCHASGLQPIEGSVNGYRTPPFREGGVSCERCHGPGEAHIKGARAQIVNPAKLDAVRRDSVCAQCHLSGVTEIAKKNAPAYRPGGLLTDASTVFVWSRGGSTNANGHFERMAQSVCWQASDRRLWCGSCHDPHSRPTEASKVAYYRKRCLSCHTNSNCSEKPAARAAAKDNCIQCHMPTTKMLTVRHAAATDHSIPRVANANTMTAAASGVLVAFEGEAGGRELGLAYSDVALKDNNRQWGARAFPLLEKAYAADPGDTKVAAQLAQLYERVGNEAKACELYKVVVDADPDVIAAAVNLGACLAKRGAIDESIRLWTEVLKRSPGLESARVNLAVALLKTGDSASAKQVVEEGLKVNPLSDALLALRKQLRA